MGEFWGGIMRTYLVIYYEDIEDKTFWEVERIFSSYEGAERYIHSQPAEEYEHYDIEVHEVEYD